jgi:hypothetical protein
VWAKAEDLLNALLELTERRELAVGKLLGLAHDPSLLPPDAVTVMRKHIAAKREYAIESRETSDQAPGGVCTYRS